MHLSAILPLSLKKCQKTSKANVFEAAEKNKKAKMHFAL